MPKLYAKFKSVPYCNNQLFILLLIEKSFSYFLPNQIERKFVEKFLLGVFTLDVSSSVIYTVNTCTKHSLGRGGGPVFNQRTWESFQGIFMKFQANNFRHELC